MKSLKIGNHLTIQGLWAIVEDLEFLHVAAILDVRMAFAYLSIQSSLLLSESSFETSQFPHWSPTRIKTQNSW